MRRGNTGFSIFNNNTLGRGNAQSPRGEEEQIWCRFLPVYQTTVGQYIQLIRDPESGDHIRGVAAGGSQCGFDPDAADFGQQVSNPREQAVFRVPYRAASATMLNKSAIGRRARKRHTVGKT